MPKDYVHFEQKVLQVYRDLDADAEHNVNVGGLQIDVLATQRTPDGSTVRSAVECKNWSRPVGVNQAAEIASRMSSLRSSGLVDKAVVVSAHGFTQDARTLFTSHRIECFSFVDLQRRLADFTNYLRHVRDQYAELEVSKNRSFISLGAGTERGEEIPSLVDWIREWIDGPGQLLSILGEYGSGKSTTSLHIAAELARDHLRGDTSGRVPVFVELRRFGRHFNLRGFLTDVLAREYSVNLHSYKAFETLNRDGKLLLILDGFDEMVNQVDPALVFRNFDEILELVEKRAKIILTCRLSFFRDRAALDRLQSGTDLFGLIHKHRSYKVVFLRGYSETQIQQYLSCYYGDKWPLFYDEILGNSRLSSIAERPILLNMIVGTVSSAKSLAEVDITSLYRKYTDIWLDRDNWRCHMSREDRRTVSECLAFELCKSDNKTIHYLQLKQKVSEVFGEVDSAQILDQYAHEVQTCTFLRNDLEGFYSFVHLSFAEYLAASFMFRAILREDFSVLAERISIETLDFLGELLAEARDDVVPRLWAILKEASHETSESVTMVRSVACYLLLRCGGEVADADLSGIVLPKGANLNGVNLQNTDLRNSAGENISFENADLAGSDCRDSQFRSCSFHKANLKDARFDNACLQECDFTFSDMINASFDAADLDHARVTPDDFMGHRQRANSEKLLESIARIRRLSGFAGDLLRYHSTNDVINAVWNWTSSDGSEKLAVDAETLRCSVEEAFVGRSKQQSDMMADVNRRFKTRQ